MLGVFAGYHGERRLISAWKVTMSLLLVVGWQTGGSDRLLGRIVLVCCRIQVRSRIFSSVGYYLFGDFHLYRSICRRLDETYPILRLYY
jgi:hypothetical protein